MAHSRWSPFDGESDQSIPGRRLADAAESDRQTNSMIEELFAQDMQPAEEVDLQPFHLAIVAATLVSHARHDLVQAPLLRGLLATGMPESEAVPLSSEVAVDSSYASARVRMGDITVGVVVGCDVRGKRFVDG